MWVDLANEHIEFLVFLVLQFWLQNMVNTQCGFPLDTNLTKWLSKCESSLQRAKMKDTHKEQWKMELHIKIERELTELEKN